MNCPHCENDFAFDDNEVECSCGKWSAIYSAESEKDFESIVRTIDDASEIRIDALTGYETKSFAVSKNGAPGSKVEIVEIGSEQAGRLVDPDVVEFAHAVFDTSFQNIPSRSEFGTILDPGRLLYDIKEIFRLPTGHPVSIKVVANTIAGGYFYIKAGYWSRTNDVTHSSLTVSLPKPFEGEYVETITWPRGNESEFQKVNETELYLMESFCPAALKLFVDFLSSALKIE